MTALQYLSWANFRATVFRSGQQGVHRVSTTPRIEVFGDGIRNRVGLLIETSADTEIPPEFQRLALITTRILNRGGLRLLEVATAKTSLHRHFYHFSMAVAERAIVERRPAVEALALELQCFGALLEEMTLLGIERQIGLLGELIFLERIVELSGVGAVDAWLGPTREPHDFRLGTREFEVKATVSPRRIHTIHGAEQLVASEGCNLFLASVMLGPSGASDGFSLSGKAEALSRTFASDYARLAQFTTALEASGFRAAESAHYARRFVIRRPMGIVPVDDRFPAITRNTIEQALGPLAPRVDSLRYDVDVDGLEQEDGTTEFQRLIQT